jgi:hypothetical protein
MVDLEVDMGTARLSGSTMELTRDVTDEIGGDYLADERMAHAWTRGLYAEVALQSSGVAREYDLDFPPSAHPGRELSTASLFVLAILTFLVWGGWKLISLMLAALV